MNTLTTNEKLALKSYWNMPIRVKDGNVEGKKGECWGILCNINEGKENAKIILEKSKR